MIFDAVGNRSLSDCRRALTPRGTLVLCGARILRGLLARVLAALVWSRFVGQRMLPFLAKRSEEDLILLKELIEAGKVTPVIDRAYPLGEAPEAIRYLAAGHAQGKVVITV